ncbi:MAG TPA: efflux RND transporter periplasmic adaptor subunit [Labilithrix sp.]|nr:efflux RND transporter periplasmic adaptor subunit [Labilithrix sp.]
MLKKAASWVVLGLVLTGLAFGIWRWQASRAAPEVTYRTAPVERRKIVARVTASGTLQATVTVQVGAQVSGRIAKLSADYNSPVKKGAVIAKLDPQLFVAAVEREKANYVAAKAGVVRAEAQQKDAELVQKRAKSLNDQGLASAAELQTADTNVAVAIAQTEVAKATLQQQSAALNQAQVNLSYTDIHSPIDGVVISRSVDVGQTVAASLQAPVLFTIAEDLKKMQVHTSVAEGDVGRLQPGMETWFTVDAFPGQRFKGKISQIRNAAQTVQNVVTYDAVIDVDNDDLRLRPGMTATTTIVFAEKSDVLVIPNAAMRFKPPAEVASAVASGAPPSGPAASLSVTAAGADAPSAKPRGRRPPGEKGDSPERTLYVLRSGRPETASVTTGLSDGTSTEVVSGELKEGDLVIVEANVAGKPASSGPAPRMGRMF